MGATSVRVTENIDLSGYNYPDSALVETKQARVGKSVYILHEIWYAGDPAGLFDNAPNGSKINDITNGDTYIKAGTLGLADGALTQT